MWTGIADKLTGVTGQIFHLADIRPISGGCINKAYRIEAKDGRIFFAKINAPDSLECFRCESESLRALRHVRSILLPKPLHHGISGGKAYLILQYIDLSGRPNPTLLGQQLASLHLNHGERYGWHGDNFIGLTPQKNHWSYSWIDFFRSERLEFQLRLNYDKGYRYEYSFALLEKLEVFFDDYIPIPSLLHGDLWGGNTAYTPKGYPVLFDPAAYYGDRETDLAMTELFGRFAPAFYTAYEERWPLHPGYTKRKPLYQLYHILNHAYLFGGSYEAQADHLISKLYFSA